MEFKVQRNDRRTAVGGDWTITIEGEDLKEAVTQNISRISYVSDYYGDSIVLPANAKVSWYPSSAGLTKKFKMWPDGTTREYTEEEYEADSGFISLTLDWKRGNEAKQREIKIYGKESDVQGIEPWVIEGK
ncbi:hypothetical protein M5X17_04495 [Paenibacillus alvei]|uniref:hypothetical protein n=1 Tax=Paenibacillus alvei TaxID=44250 RepID=UPI00227DBB68|nr:hypothetical protein [Paenibacillus alvei]MCY9733019.1 hypothetical protein [Paenibacillus alvei]